jgi:hypothetical protein
MLLLNVRLQKTSELMTLIDRLKRLPTTNWGCGVTAAQQAFNMHGEGSNPSDPIERKPFRANARTEHEIEVFAAAYQMLCTRRARGGRRFAVKNLSPRPQVSEIRCSGSISGS